VCVRVCACVRGVCMYVCVTALRCKEAEKVARDATRCASKELYLVQAQASHLRQQVDTLTKDKDAALRDREVALKDKQLLYVTNRQREDEVCLCMYMCIYTCMYKYTHITIHMCVYVKRVALLG